MTAAELATGAVMLVGLVAAPLLPGMIQSQKAYLQGRVGASIWQPYRDLRRLWHKRVVQPSGTTVIYLVAPAASAAALLAAILIVPAAANAPQFGVGHDALVVVGVLALARGLLALSAWDTTSSFGLMSAGRDLTFAVAGELLLALVLLTAVLPVGSTDLGAMWLGASGSGIWSHPAHWCGLVGMVLILLIETGRQPIDNPDTHLELTMVHEGPLLEYAGRDLAYLQWSAAARHWVVMLLAAGLFLPHPSGTVAGLAAVLGWVVALTVLLALIETMTAKMRLLRVPHLIGATGLLALGGVASWILGAAL
jgi:formate hydrogenlyase subunit 4